MHDYTHAVEAPMPTVARLALMLCAALPSFPCLAAGPTEDSLRAADAEQMRIIVQGDAEAQSRFMHPNYILNGPSNRVLRKAVLVKMLGEGKMASDRFERTIEGTAITGNVGIVMGRETVKPAAGSNLGEKFGSRDLTRRFTNVFIFDHGAWRFLARQASVVDMPCK
ncbi:nuclear transport factor 2 family protein [Frateuria sp. YIM B11624]|uniref:nuclear transport factor 2 family protein n=1 Tax=Frateuria sp. YIM B11624 TaxID=3143185 RepID=UPI003C73D50D